ncbi:MAG: glutamine--tRNA ligase/YqeY domain fusion protein [Anaerolineae bacterium]|nr:glutamine--tRNA ligase/YqeY domain fusion protein [Anaerolineae bacterium]
MNAQNNLTENETRPSNFVWDIVDEHNASGRFGGQVITRFPPEPNGYLHIGHSKAISLNFETARRYGGKCNLRFDDTNPAKEEQEYIDGIIEDIRWLGFDWGDKIYYASDYFRQLYEWAVQLIKQGVAYVDHLSADEIREYRGTLTEPGKNSPYRDRSVEENLALFEKMKSGDFKDGECVLRAKIDMASPNINLRDPVLYRILHEAHPRTGNQWCIYPMYDWAHGQSDSIEGVTHSICTLEFEAHRPLYDWFLDQLGIHHPQQIEFARLNLTYTVMSKRMLKQLVDEGHVGGWNDPRMPTLSGLRRRGYTPKAIRDLCDRTGVAKSNGVVEIEHLEHTIRQDLNRHALRRMAVLDPIKVVIVNYPKGLVEEVEMINNPEDESAGTRKAPFSRELYIEREDFMEDPPRKFFRLSPGSEVRLRYAYFIICTGVIKDADGKIVEVHCTYDPETRGGNAPDGRKVKATLHWLSAPHARTAEVRLYDRLFVEPEPGKDFLNALNPDSLTVLGHCYIEPALIDAGLGEHYQFERIGYFCLDPDSTDGKPIFNRTVTLRDTWAKIQQKQA